MSTAYHFSFAFNPSCTFPFPCSWSAVGLNTAVSFTHASILVVMNSLIVSRMQLLGLSEAFQNFTVSHITYEVFYWLPCCRELNLMFQSGSCRNFVALFLVWQAIEIFAPWTLLLLLLHCDYCNIVLFSGWAIHLEVSSSSSWSMHPSGHGCLTHLSSALGNRSLTTEMLVRLQIFLDLATSDFLVSWALLA